MSACRWDGDEETLDSCTCADRVESEMAAEYDRQRQYDQPPSERIEPPHTAKPGIVKRP